MYRLKGMLCWCPEVALCFTAVCYAMLVWAVLFTESAHSGWTTLNACWDYSPIQDAWPGAHASQSFNL